MHSETEKKIKYTMAGLWKWKLFFNCISLSIISSVLYFTPIFSLFFHDIDILFYKKFQLLVSSSPYLQTIFILSNHQSSHILFYILGSFLWIFSVKNFPSHLISYKFAEKIFSIFIILFTVFVINYLVIHEFFHFHRLAPKFCNPLSNILLEISSWIHSKTNETFIFPNIFSTIVTSYIFLTVIQSGIRKSIITILLGIYFLIPLLFLGNYGITDIILGSCSLSLAMTAISHHTPIYYYFVTNLEKFIRKLTKSNRA